jgi:outer membrane autotransporter protein
MQSGGATVSFGDAESLRGGIGARLGTTLKNKDGSTTEFTVLGRLWNEFAGDNTVTISDGSNSNKFTNDIGGLYEEVSGTVTFASVNHLSVYVSGGGIFGADSTTWDAKAGVRKEF